MFKGLFFFFFFFQWRTFRHFCTLVGHGGLSLGLESVLNMDYCGGSHDTTCVTEGNPFPRRFNWIFLFYYDDVDVT